MHNMPDDIRQYDDDPNSPLYVAPDVVCEICSEAFIVEEMANETVCIYCMNEQDDD